MRYLLFSAVLVFLAACEEAPTVDPNAAWNLVSEDSRISFVSVKAGDIGETHYFKQLSGSVSPEGAVTVDIPLDSVETNIDIRNERMRDLFFEVVKFPTAQMSATVDLNSLQALEVGQRQEIEIPFKLDLHGLSSEYDAKIFITRIGMSRVSVATAEPILLSVDEFDLGPGLEELKVIAGLPSITPTVPVTASLVFTQ